MLHLVLEAEPDKLQDRLRLRMDVEVPKKAQHLFLDVIAIRYCLSHRRPRSGTTLGPRYPFTKPLIIRIEVKQVVFGIDFVAGLMSLQHRLKKPGSVPDVPAWRT